MGLEKWLFKNIIAQWYFNLLINNYISNWNPARVMVL